jgi:hypothetical protein
VAVYPDPLLTEPLVSLDESVEHQVELLVLLAEPLAESAEPLAEPVEPLESLDL